MKRAAFLRIIRIGAPVLLMLFFFFTAAINLYPAGANVTRKNPLKKVNKWFILLDYDPSSGNDTLSRNSRFDMSILDPDHFPDISGFEKGTILIAYLSIGEAEEYRAYWEKIKDKPWVREENPDWAGNYPVDVRNDEWKNILIHEMIPMIKAKGFQGLMLDTIDTASMHEDTDPAGYKGSRQAMVALIGEIHDKYPKMYLISNNGFSLLDDISPFLDGMLVEDINMMVDFAGKGYKKVPAGERKEKLKEIRKIQEKYKLPVFNVDYAAEDDKRSIKRCIATSKRLGFKPYVAEGALDRIYRQDDRKRL